MITADHKSMIITNPNTVIKVFNVVNIFYKGVHIGVNVDTSPSRIFCTVDKDGMVPGRDGMGFDGS